MGYRRLVIILKRMCGHYGRMRKVWRANGCTSNHSQVFEGFMAAEEDDEVQSFQSNFLGDLEGRYEWWTKSQTSQWANWTAKAIV